MKTLCAMVGIMVRVRDENVASQDPTMRGIERSVRNGRAVGEARSVTELVRFSRSVINGSVALETPST